MSSIFSGAGPTDTNLQTRPREINADRSFFQSFIYCSYWDTFVYNKQNSPFSPSVPILNINKGPGIRSDHGLCPKCGNEREKRNGNKNPIIES